MQERFRDGASVLSTYSFDIGHHEEDPDDQRRNITRTARTDGVGFVRQQSDKSPQTFKFAGTIMKAEQKTAMQGYFDACDNRTVFFRDYTGTEYEVLITVFSCTRVPVLRNMRDPSIMHIWKYNLEMEVIS